MSQETIEWIFSDTGSHMILTLISIFIGIVFLFIWFFSKSKDYDDYKYIGSGLIFGSPITGPLMMIILYLFVCIMPLYLIGKGLVKLKNLYHKKNKLI